MTIITLDWNATRVSAVLGTAGEYPLPVPLEPPGADLPLVINLEKKTPDVGSGGLRLVRQSPQLICQNFLYMLARTGPKKSLDARQACELVWRKLQPLCKSAHGIVLTVPGYLQPDQAAALHRLGDQANLPLLGSLPTTLAAAMAGHCEQFWQQSVIVVDADDHAVTIAWVKALTEKANLIESRSFPNLGMRFWKDRLINALADLCVWQHRIDPRDAPLAEQSLFDQLDVLIGAARQRRAIQLGVQSQQWFKHLLVHPEQTELFCAPLVRQIVGEVEHLMLGCPKDSLPRGILLTHQAGQLPGLVDALQSLTRTGPEAESARRLQQSFATVEEDFGDELLFHDVEELAGVLVLPPEAPARAAHGLAEQFRDGLLPIGHLETIVPLPLPQPADSGPARLHFQGRDYLLHETSFMLGSQFGSHLWFDRHDHPEVAPQHCEIIFEHRVFVLHNHAREGTLINDQPATRQAVLHAGDRIRLGQGGPVVRFLGRSLPRPVQPACVT